MKNVTKLSSNLLNKLKTYSLSAGAVIGTGAAAQAGVVYTDVDPDYMGSAGDTAYVDINGDGTVDFAFLANSASFTTSSIPVLIERVFAVGFGDAGIAGSSTYSYRYPYALDNGAVVGCEDNFNDFPNALETMAWVQDVGGSVSTFGNWEGATDKYLGVRITVSGEVHYGWIRIDVSAPNFTIKDMAFEDVPGMPIVAGAMSSMDMGVSNIMGNDNGDAGNGSDLQVTFDASPAEDAITEYRIMVVKESQAAAIDAATALAAPATSYTAVTPTGNAQVVTLAANANDLNGDPIMTWVDYRIMVLSIFDCDDYDGSISKADSTTTLNPPAGIDNGNLDGLNVFTNGNVLNVNNLQTAHLNKNLVIMNTAGQRVMTRKIKSTSESIELNLASGIYIVNIEGTAAAHKVYVQ